MSRADVRPVITVLATMCSSPGHHIGWVSRRSGNEDDTSSLHLFRDSDQMNRLRLHPVSLHHDLPTFSASIAADDLTRDTVDAELFGVQP